MRASDIANRLGAKEGRNGRWTATCPSHDDTNPSLEITDGNGVILLRCWAGCPLDDICKALGLRLRDLHHEAPSGYPVSRKPIPRVYQPPHSVCDIDRKAEARLHQVWRESAPIRPDTPAGRYLQIRHLDNNVPATLRANPRLICSMCKDEGVPDPYHPGIVAEVSAPNGLMASIHRTFLTETGQKAHGGQSKRLMPGVFNGCTRGGAIRLYPHGAQLGICEGIETATAAHRLFGIPVWSAVSSGGMERIEIPREVELVVILPDNDTAGLKAAKALGRRMLILGRRFKLLHPSKPGADWADVLSEQVRTEHHINIMEATDVR